MMAFPGKDWLSFEVWNKTKAIWLISIANLILNALTVYLLWDLTNIMKALVHGGAGAVVSHAAQQQIAVVSGGGGS